MIQLLTIDNEILKDAWGNGGSFCRIVYSPEIERALEQAFGRPGLCLKVFHTPIAENLEDFEWTGTPIIETAKVQNLFALFDLAPMVYRIVLLNNKCLAQVTEYATGEGKADIFLAKTLIDKYNIGTRNVKDGKEIFDFRYACNWVGKWLVDFGGWYFKNG